MANITIKFKDGSERVFKHEGRAGGSYTKTLRLEAGFAIMEDEDYKRFVFPAETIAEIVSEPHRR